jgi:hypothetical protein
VPGCEKVFSCGAAVINRNNARKRLRLEVPKTPFRQKWLCRFRFTWFGLSSRWEIEGTFGWLRAFDQRHHLMSHLAARLIDPRQGDRVRHEALALLHQRI